ncbi:MAG: hypothetical protein FJ217_08405 [Ignavibacteria bacterium]|nr:hypothetical protein [Ignavibacteria bacterium]
MNSTRVALCMLAVLSFCFFGMSLSAQTQYASPHKAFETAEGLVNDIYKSVSFDSTGPKPDWEKVRSMFIEEAVIVLRVTRDSSAIFSVQGFINDFVNFIERSPAKQRGFWEKVVRMKPMVFGDIAHVLVLYEAHIPGSPRPPQKGVDSFQLIKRSGRWWIAAVTNEIPTRDRPVPKELQD